MPFDGAHRVERRRDGGEVVRDSVVPVDGHAPRFAGVDPVNRDAGIVRFALRDFREPVQAQLQVAADHEVVVEDAHAPGSARTRDTPSAMLSSAFRV